MRHAGEQREIKEDKSCRSSDSVEKERRLQNACERMQTAALRTPFYAGRELARMSCLRGPSHVSRCFPSLTCVECFRRLCVRVVFVARAPFFSAADIRSISFLRVRDLRT